MVQALAITLQSVQMMMSELHVVVASTIAASKFEKD